MKKKGFTLVEVLAVIIILGLLSSIAIVSIGRYRQKALEDEKKSVRGSIVSAYNNYRITQPVKKAKLDKTTYKLEELSAEKGNITSLSELTFDKALKYDGKLCNLSESYVYYVVQGDFGKTATIDDFHTGESSTISSKAEEVCVYLECDGKVVVDDTIKDESYCNKDTDYTPEVEQEEQALPGDE